VTGKYVWDSTLFYDNLKQVRQNLQRLENVDVSTMIDYSDSSLAPSHTKEDLSKSISPLPVVPVFPVHPSQDVFLAEEKASAEEYPVFDLRCDSESTDVLQRLLNV
jgi:hypothetical protein